MDDISPVMVDEEGESKGDLVGVPDLGGVVGRANVVGVGGTKANCGATGKFITWLGV